MKIGKNDDEVGKKNFTHKFAFLQYMKIGLRCVSCASCLSFYLY